MNLIRRSPQAHFELPYSTVFRRIVEGFSHRTVCIAPSMSDHNNEQLTSPGSTLGRYHCPMQLERSRNKTETIDATGAVGS